MVRLIGAVMVAMAAMGTAMVQASPVATEHVTARLLSEWNSLPPEGGTFSVALEQKIIPGWHTYWRNPGDSGEATSIDWELPEGFEAGDIEWPTPDRVPFQTLVNFGFKGTVVFPVKITAPDGLAPGETVNVTADVHWLVCEEICIPEDVTLTLSLPVRDGAPQINDAAAKTIEAARARLPRPGSWNAAFDGAKDHLRVAIDAPELVPAFDAKRVKDVAFFPYEDGIILNAAEQDATVADGKVVLSLTPGFLFTQNGMTAPDKMDGILVLREKGEGGEILETAFDLSAQPGEVAARGPAPTAGLIPLWRALIYAVLGGLIMNLMPCVFPVIFLKALGFVSLAREAPAKVRQHGLLYTGGVLLSFVALGGLLFALRAAGSEVGWGFQLQSPIVVAALIYLLFIVGLNLSGVFDVGTSLQGVGGSLAEMRGPGGAFFTGVLAVVVAAPCTAPFMALALGTAMALPALEGLTVFLALGLGMALPYLVLSFAPQLAAKLPRPGPWMERLKQLLAFPLYLTAVWLLWVLAEQNVGADGIGIILTGLVFIAFAGWLMHTRSKLRSGWRRTMMVLALVSIIGAGGALTLLKGGASASTAATTDITAKGPRVPYEDFTQTRLDEALKGDRPVFLNFTAAWCITCHLNDINALSADDVVDRFKALNVDYLRGDWTSRDPEITRILERFGRAGVPLYVYYGPPVSGKRPDPVILPPLLSESTVLRTLEGK